MFLAKKSAEPLDSAHCFSVDLRWLSNYLELFVQLGIFKRLVDFTV